MRFSATLTKRTALGWAGLALIWTATTAQAQLIISIFPSQGDPTKTLWLFGPSDNYRDFVSNAHYGSSIRNITATNYHVRDSWTRTNPGQGNIYFNNNPTNQVLNLSPLFSSTNHPKDIASITRRLPGAPSFGTFSTNIFLFGSNNFTNEPTISAGSATKTIGGIFMNDAAVDEIGIRGTAGGGNLVYTNGQSIRWFGSGVLDKPIGDFFQNDNVNYRGIGNAQNAPYFVSGSGNISLRFRRHVIPEPEEHALVFGLFALAFAIIHRQFKRNRQL